jgi:hypothetical protein
MTNGNHKHDSLYRLKINFTLNIPDSSQNNLSLNNRVCNLLTGLRFEMERIQYSKKTNSNFNLINQSHENV